MKVLNLEGLFKAMDRFDPNLYETLSNNEQKLLVDFIRSYFGREDYFDKDFEVSENMTPSDFSYVFDLHIYLAYAITNIPTVEKQFFSVPNFTHQDFCNTCYFFGFMSLFSEKYIELIKLFIEELKSVSLPKLLQIDWKQDVDEMSETELYDFLVGMSHRNATLILDRINCSNDIKNALKKNVINKNEEAFIDTIINANVDIGNISAAASILSLLYKVKDAMRLISHVSDEPDNISLEQVRSYYSNIYKETQTLLDDEIIDFYQSVPMAEKGFLPNLDWGYWYRNTLKLDAFIVVFHHEIKRISNDIDAVSKVDKYIKDWYYFKSLSDKIFSGQIELEDYNPDESPLRDFRDKFLMKMELPENILVGAKNCGEYLESDRTPDKWYCIKLYQALVKANLLSYDDDTFYSFVYRMSRDYKGSEEPIKIVWLGKPREIYYLINWFCKDAASKMWKKTANFFCLPEGAKLKDNGVKNQAKTPTPKIASIIEEMSK